MKLSDELLVYVPVEGEELLEGEMQSSYQDTSQVMMTEWSTLILQMKSQLMTIPGIGPAKAAAIIAVSG